MILFVFDVNKSFLIYSSHPLTIPSSRLPYDLLLKENLDHSNINVVFPRGERFQAKIYRGIAGYGEYYQIRIGGNNRHLPDYLAIGDRLHAILCRIDNLSYFIIEQLSCSNTPK